VRERNRTNNKTDKDETDQERDIATKKYVINRMKVQYVTQRDSMQDSKLADSVTEAAIANMQVNTYEIHNVAHI